MKELSELELISRDGSITYKSAVVNVNENIIQVSDRFHLLQGLTNAAKKYITSYFKANIGLPVSASHYDGTETSDYWNKDMGRKDLPTREHTAATERKIKLVDEVRKLYNEGYSERKIADIVGINGKTVNRYLNPDFNPENGNYNTSSPSKLKKYTNEIKDMLSKGKSFKEIEAAVREKGYDGASSTIRMFATRERKVIKESGGAGSKNSERIERKWLVSLLYKPIDKVKKITQEQLDLIISENPMVGKLYDTVKSFKEVLFAKNEDDLDIWIDDAAQLGIDEVDSFIGGIKRDIEAVKNAIKFEFNNGLAEGSVNKLKVIKRIMYGRCSFELLRKKTLRLEAKRKVN